MQNCQDNYSTTFSSYSAMYDYHDEQTKKSQWITCRVDELQIEPLDAASPLYGNLSAFALGTSLDAVEDTASNLMEIYLHSRLDPVWMLWKIQHLTLGLPCASMGIFIHCA